MLRTTSFIPTHKGTLYRSVVFTETGREQYSDPVSLRFSVVRIRTQTRETSVRTDQSGSQGRAAEDVFDGRILCHPELEPMMGQGVKVNGYQYRVDEVQPRYDAAGNLNHFQVDLVL